MRRFSDHLAEELYHLGFSDGLPRHISRRAYRRLRLLVAARSLQDVSIMGRIARSLKSEGVYGVHVEGKWFIWFKWGEQLGAFDIHLGKWKRERPQG